MKKIISLLSSMVKAKITGVKNKADAMRVRLVIFSLLKGKSKLSLGSISNKIHALLDRKDDNNNNNLTQDIIIVAKDQSKALVVYDDHDDDKCRPDDVTHLVFSEEELLDDVDQGKSIIDLVKDSKDHQGEEFSLEDEIDHAADLFIKRFRRQMCLQKLESFKRCQQMLARSV